MWIRNQLTKLLPACLSPFSVYLPPLNSFPSILFTAITTSSICRSVAISKLVKYSMGTSAPVTHTNGASKTPKQSSMVHAMVSNLTPLLVQHLLYRHHHVVYLRER